VIFQSANEINQNRILKERQAELLATREAEKEWWEKRKEGIKTQLLVELDEEDAKKENKTPSTPAKKGGSDDDAVLVEAGGKADGNTNKGSAKKKGKN
jgi:translocation protein SEC66